MTAATPRRLLARSYLRRDRFLLSGWIAGGVFLYVSQAKSVDQMYPTPAALEEAAATMATSSAMLAMTGPARALDTLGGQVAWQSASYGAVAAGLMSMLIVGRHTRLEEETGRSELIRAGALGRLTPLVSAVVLALGANVVLGVLVAASLVGYGLPSAGSWALGGALAAAGWVFTGVAAVAAQLTLSTRAAYGISAGVLGASFLLRALGDTGAASLSWASPIGWGQATRPYAGERWWPLGLSVAVALLLVLLAAWLHGRRDHGGAAWSDRARPLDDTAVGPWGLVWRLQRGALLGWALAVALVGLGWGAMADSADEIVGDSDFAVDVFATSSAPVDGFLGTTILILALLCTAAGVMCAQRPDAEERSGRVDTLLAGRLSRTRWSVQHGAVACAGSVALLLVAGLATGAGYALVGGGSSDLWRLTGAAVAYAPAVLTVVAVVQLAHGLGWSASLVGWALLGWCVVVGMFREVLDLPPALAALSPLDHVPTMPLEAFDPAAVTALGAAAVVVVVGGELLLRRRDLR